MARYDYEQDAFTSEEFSHYSNVINNGTARIPICFCIDVSKSMGWLTNPSDELEVVGSGHEDGGEVNEVKVKPGFKKKTKLDDLKRVLSELIDGLQNSSELKDAVVVNIVTFSRHADTIVNFCEPASLNTRAVAGKIMLGADVTNVSEGINLALGKLDAMGEVLSSAQTESYKPVFVFLSDGLPTDKYDALNAVAELKRREKRDGLMALPIGIYMNYDGKAWLSTLREDGRIFTMDSDIEFREVFEMIKELICYKTPVISVDEEISAENPYTKDNDISSTAYGQVSTPEDLFKNFAFPEGV